MAYAIIRSTKVKNVQTVLRCFDHNERNYDVANSDQKKSILNETLKTLSGTSIMEEIDRRKEVAQKVTGHKVRKDAVLLLETVCSFSPEAERTIDLDSWNKKNLEWLENHYGKDNVVSVILHMDEKTPHIHALIIPIDERGCFNAKKIYGNREDMRRMQTSYAEAMKEFGLERGLEESMARHKEIKKFYAEIQKTMDIKIPSIMPGESMEDYAIRIRQVAEQANQRYLDEKIRAERLMAERDTYKQQKTKYELALERRTKKLDSQIEENEKLIETVKKLEKKAQVVDDISQGLKALEDEGKRIGTEIDKIVLPKGREVRKEKEREVDR